MMMIYILLTAHFLAEFSFQPAGLARGKRENFRFLAVHSAIYAGVFLTPLFLLVKFRYAFPAFILIVILHILLDWGRTLLEGKCEDRHSRFALFLADQVLHISVISIVCFFFRLWEHTGFVYGNLMKWNHFEEFVIYFLIFVIIWDPASVFVKNLFLYLENSNTGITAEEEPQIGRIIGKLERLIISILILCDQFGAVGFVLTAKSIARFRQLEDKNFAEKYLVGTLTSTVIAFITTLVLSQVL